MDLPSKYSKPMEKLTCRFWIFTLLSESFGIKFVAHLMFANSVSQTWQLNEPNQIRFKPRVRYEIWDYLPMLDRLLITQRIHEPEAQI